MTKNYLNAMSKKHHMHSS